MADDKRSLGGVDLTYSRGIMKILKNLGYTHCFFLAGGNAMYLLQAADSEFKCVPFVHEVSAVIAAEQFNLSSVGRAWVLVTAGPGLTNSITGIAGAWLESHGVLVIGAQVKTDDIGVDHGYRQIGIQEIDGVAAARPFCKRAFRVEDSTTADEIRNAVMESARGRPGPVFLEMPLDLSARAVPRGWLKEHPTSNLSENEPDLELQVEVAIESLTQAKRPVFLLGQGCSRGEAQAFADTLNSFSVPVVTSWTGADRVSSDSPNYFGRPNFYGMRYSNIIVQQSDLVVTVGARLGLQQTGFNVGEFAKNARIISVDLDPKELERPLPLRHQKVLADSTSFMKLFESKLFGKNLDISFESWLDYCRQVAEAFPLDEYGRDKVGEGINPYALIEAVSDLSLEGNSIVSCSSGGTFTAFMQAFKNKRGQHIYSNKGLASMGYGLASAIGAGLARPNEPIVLFEGDGGFAQNLQELGTVAKLALDAKMFLFDNQGYASIRSNQRRFFEGGYVGCDPSTGLGLPSWASIAAAYSIRFVDLPVDSWREQLHEVMNESGPILIRVPVDPEFNYIPKILSRSQGGSLISNPLQTMDPPIQDQMLARLASQYSHDT